jgi:hypothetical protein
MATNIKDVKASSRIEQAYHCFVLNISCTIGILECINGFLCIRISRTNASCGTRMAKKIDL